MKRSVAIISECHSKNLGDQAIAQAFSEILQPQYRVNRVSYGTVEAQNPAGGLRHASPTKRQQAISRLTSPLSPKTKAITKWHLLAEKKKFEEHFRSAVKEADVVLVGGGQLIKNNIALFCQKFALVAEISANQSIPFAAVGIGVDRKMTRSKWKTVSRGASSAKCIILRDEISRQRMKTALSCDGNFTVHPDLAFALQNPYRHRSAGCRGIPLAINVMNLATMIGSPTSTSSREAHSLMKSYCRIIEEALKTWPSITLFTSGSLDDLRAATSIKEMALKEIGVDLPVFHPETLDDLLLFLGNTTDVFAARMHAGILAYISGCNPLCISWDDKVEGVWAVIGEERRVISLSDLTTENTVKDLFQIFRNLTSPSSIDIDMLSDSVSRGIREAVAKVLDTSDLA